MSFRRDAGLELAKSGKCQAHGRVVRVPSRSKTGAVHFVNLKNTLRPRCGCKDNVVNNQHCAHIWAAKFLLEWEQPSESTPNARERGEKQYPRDWARYNVAEESAPRLARGILAYLADNLIELSDDRPGAA